jgi:hydrogenase maturation protein HypF
LLPFHLPGGDQAAREPRRTAIAVLYETLGKEIFERNNLPPLHDWSDGELDVLAIMLNKQINCPITTSMGRLFDAVSAILGFCQISDFEAEAATYLEFAAERSNTSELYSFDIIERAKHKAIDWRPIIRGILEDIRNQAAKETIAAKFHNTLVEAAIGIVQTTNIRDIALSGGCFQNKYLAERMINRLKSESFRPHWHREIPCNDGGICAGQILAAIRAERNI